MIFDVHSYVPGAGYPEPSASPNADGAAAAPAADAVSPSVPAAETAVAEVEATPAPVPVAPYMLGVPEDVHHTLQTPENLAVLTGFSAAAGEAGLPQPVAEALLGSYIDSQHVFDYGSGAGEDYSPADCIRVLERFWGSEDFDKNLAEVRATAKSLGEPFLTWLDDTQQGNNPAALVALLHLKDLRRDPKDAAAELTALMATKEYQTGNQRTMLRVRALSRVAHRS